MCIRDSFGLESDESDSNETANLANKAAGVAIATGLEKTLAGGESFQLSEAMMEQRAQELVEMRKRIRDKQKLFLELIK